MKKYFLNKMSTGKRLAKRSIIGTRVCAMGSDGLWYSGVIQAVKTPSSPNIRENNNCINLTPNTKYTVRFAPTDRDNMARLGLAREFRDTELIGPGFRNIMDVKLNPGQKIFLTYNGRESSGEVISHDETKDEVSVQIYLMGQESPLELKKKLEEVRLLESRRSARLADQERDTDFARLADMANDRRRQSHSIDVPFPLTQNGSRKRRTSYSQDERDYFINSINDDDPMDECNAALVLMSLSCSPHSPRAAWETQLGSSPGSSSASWSTGSSSPPLSDDGSAPPITNVTRRGPRTTSLSTSDEGIVMDYNEDLPRKRRANEPLYQCIWKGCYAIYSTLTDITSHIRSAHLGPRKPDDDSDEEDFYIQELDEESAPSPPSPPTLSHRDMARPPHEDPEYQRQIVGNFRQGLLQLTQTSIKPPLPTASISNAGILHQTVANTLLHHSYSWSQASPTSPQKHVRLSPRPSTSYAPYPSPTYSTVIAQHHQQLQHQINGQHLNMSPNNNNNNNNNNHFSTANTTTTSMNLTPTSSSAVANNQTNHRSPVSPNRRTRGENKKCRKVYGMDRKEMWCTQCKWKKACSRFGD
uniref:CSON013853 protein n=1 Tax=Culicoides sonorensis TaxID=179676 RepID=A0A336MCZ1_CULSO